MNLKQLVAAIATEAIGLLHRLVTSEPDLSQFSGQASATTRHLAGLLWQARRYGAIAGTIENGRGVRLRAELVRAEHVPAGLSLENRRNTAMRSPRSGGCTLRSRGFAPPLPGLRSNAGSCLAPGLKASQQPNSSPIRWLS